MYINGSDVMVNCDFHAGVEGASCVLVHRKFGNESIRVEEYPQTTVFPMAVFVDDDPEKHNFAVFGKIGPNIDERPMKAGRATDEESTSTSPTVLPTSTLLSEPSDLYVMCIVSTYTVIIPTSPVDYSGTSDDNSSNKTTITAGVISAGILVIVGVILLVVLKYRKQVTACYLNFLLPTYSW